MIKRQIEETDSDFDARSCKNVLPSSPAALRSSKSVRPPKRNSKRRSTASKMLSRRPRAVQEGMIPAAALARPALKAFDKIKSDSHEEQIGIDIIRRALEEPLRQIAENAGFEGSVEVNRVKAAALGQASMHDGQPRRHDQGRHR